MMTSAFILSPGARAPAGRGLDGEGGGLSRDNTSWGESVEEEDSGPMERMINNTAHTRQRRQTQQCQDGEQA